LKPIIHLGWYLYLQSLANSVPALDVTTPMGKLVDQKMIDQHNKLRLNKEAIRKTLDYHTDYHYKPVYDGTQATYG
jgi:7-carboxy-7-deazaguanine synthase